MMKSYLSERDAALGDTLIMFSSEAKHVTVPTRVGEMQLSHLGKGALICPQAETVTLPEGYASYSAQAISQAIPPKLRTLHLPASLREIRDTPPGPGAMGTIAIESITLDRHVTPSEYRQLLAESRAVYGNRHVLIQPRLDHPQCGLLVRALKNHGVPTPDLSRIGIPLFQREEDDGKRPSLYTTRQCLHEGNAKLNEHAGVMQRISARAWGPRLPEEECENDRLQLRGEERPRRFEFMAVITFGEAGSLASGAGKLRLTAMISRFFFQQLRPVRYRKRQYYVYSRALLYPRDFSGGVGYAREDMCVYSNAGPVVDAHLSEAVYEKYRLLNML